MNEDIIVINETKKDVSLNELFQTVLKEFKQHKEHRWRQVGRCVYCECGVRLYQGTIPKGHPTFTPPKKPSEADKMRARWGK